MVGNLLLRGMIVGAVAGLLAFGFARVYGEPSVDHAIALEEAASQAKGEAPEPEIVSREVQAGIGLFTGIVTFGAALGGLFSLAFAFSYGRLTTLGPRGTAAILALGGFVAVVLVPGLKYPPNPPAVGDPETIAYRTEFFFLMLALSLGALALAVVVARGRWQQLGGWNAALLGGGLYVVLMAIVVQALPGINEVPETFPAMLLWEFRMATLGIQAILWATLGLAFGAVAERYLAGSRPGRIASAYAGR
ncbi:CbtA family protein [Aquabacter cavernae]|uniref:CbtA family protein n=1 Tax=Aquabacter cavernae TaxID=2496029 RepID=UPI000F8D149B|nr:CbtA family protein [Aquabacter cavernae]